MARPPLSRRPARPAAARPRGSLIESLETRRLMANLVVNSLADGPVDTTDTAVTLREAVQVAAAGDTVDLTNLTGTITLGGEIVIDKSLTFDGPGSNALTVSGGEATRLFRQTGGTVAFDDVTLADGNAGAEGGGAYHNDYGGDVSFDRVVLRGNVAGDSGGAIFKLGDDLTITDSAVLDNAVDATDPNFAYGGGIYASGVNLTIESSTLAGNRVVLGEGKSGGGGGLLVSGDHKTVRIVNSTFANNSVVGNRGTWGAVYMFEMGSVVEIVGSTFANNASADGVSVHFESAEAFNGTLPQNILRDLLIVGSPESGPNQATLQLDYERIVENVVVSHGLDYGPYYTDGVDGNRFGSIENPLDVRVGVLGEHGGPTPTVPLLAGSVGIDAGSDSATEFDQRGVARRGAADVGSYEYLNTGPSFTTTFLPDATAGVAYTATLNTTDPDGDALTITATALPAWLTLTDRGDGTATLAGTPSYDDADFLLKFKAVDAEFAATLDTPLTLVKPNRAPTNLTMSGGSVAENLPAGTVVGTLAATDPDAGDVVRYELVGESDSFALDSATGVVTTLAVLDYEQASSYALRVRAIDAGGLAAERDVTINVIDAAPPVTQGPRKGIAEVGRTAAGARDVVNVARDAAGRTVVTINGESTTLDEDVVAVQIDTGDGDDELTISADAPVMLIDAGEGNDIIRFAPRTGAENTFNIIRGGPGDDYIEGTPGRDAIYGGDGDDTLLGLGGDDALFGEGGDDSLVGGDGNDSLDGGTGNDVMSGGAGVDLAWYTGRGSGVTIRLDGSATSGFRGERDAFADDVEQALGGAGGDALYGNAAANYLVGLGGDDSLYGGDGKDTLDGGEGDDLLDGGDDFDVLYAGPAAGRDRLFGGGGRDRAFAFGFARVTLEAVEERELLAAAA